MRKREREREREREGRMPFFTDEALLKERKRDCCELDGWLVRLEVVGSNASWPIAKPTEVILTLLVKQARGLFHVSLILYSPPFSEAPLASRFILRSNT